MSTHNGAPAGSPTLTFATPDEVVEFVERVKRRTGPRPPGVATIVAVAKVDESLTRAKCEWESCSEPSVGQWRWRREAADGVRDAFDFAVYCDGHGAMAQNNGAVLKERFGGGAR
jgi:hypothetical protein